MKLRKKGGAEDKGKLQIHQPQEQDEKVDSFYAGAYPGKPWQKLTDTRYAKGSIIKILSAEEQALVLAIARKYLDPLVKDFPRARLAIQKHLSDTNSALTSEFFTRASFLEKRLAIRAYLSDADGKFISHDAAIPLLTHIADSGLDFEVGAIDHIIDGVTKTEIILGDGVEVVSDKGYWFAHTHPAKRDITNNFLPSTKDLDVIIATARSRLLNLKENITENFILRDIGRTKVSVHATLIAEPAEISIDEIKIEYEYSGEMDLTIEEHIKALKNHLKMRHHLKPEKIKIGYSSLRSE